MILAAYIPTGPLALIVSLALLGAGCVVVFVAMTVWLTLIDRRERRRKERARPGYLPDRVTRSYREPSRLPECKLSLAELERMYAQPTREPRR